jgi:hypothetical protein
LELPGAGTIAALLGALLALLIAGVGAAGYVFSLKNTVDEDRRNAELRDADLERQLSARIDGLETGVRRLRAGLAVVVLYQGETVPIHAAKEELIGDPRTRMQWALCEIVNDQFDGSTLRCPGVETYLRKSDLDLATPAETQTPTAHAPPPP